MSIAVVPFTVLGGARADEQFADALSREVTNGLGRSREVRVASQRLFPGDDALQLRLECLANLNLGRYDEAVALCERSAGLDNWYWDHVLLAAAYANKGDAAEAAAKAEIDKRVPGFSIARPRHFASFVGGAACRPPVAPRRNRAPRAIMRACSTLTCSRR